MELIADQIVYQESGSMPFVVRWKSLLLCAALLGPWVAWAEPPIPRPAAIAGAGAASAPKRTQYAPLIRMQCSPVTPDTKVPWIDVSQLPDLTKDYSYFEACSDLDTAWTTQSYPDPKFVPVRTPEHQERVARFLQGVKDFVAADADDWVGYVNGWLGVELPKNRFERLPAKDGRFSDYLNSHQRLAKSSTLATEVALVSLLTSWRYAQNGRLDQHRLEVTLAGIDRSNACITSIDLQKTFADEPGYLLRPKSVRTARERPNAEQLAQLGGQWFGYEVFVFESAMSGHRSGNLVFNFGFRPCADSVTIRLTRTRPKSEAQSKEKP